MTIWRLITYHYGPQAAEMTQASQRNEVIAVGHKNVGDLNNLNFRDASELTQIIADKHTDATMSNCVNGGRSLWRLHREMQTGDLVILSEGRGKRVATMRVTGEYFFLDDESAPYYEHRRKAEEVPINPNQLWQVAGKAAEGEGTRRTLIRCAKPLTEDEFDALLVKALALFKQARNRAAGRGLLWDERQVRYCGAECLSLPIRRQYRPRFRRAESIFCRR